MEICIVRHAAAEEGKAWDKPDELRPLSDSGKKDMEHVARGLQALQVKPTNLYCSPLVRAIQTAQILQKILEVSSCEQAEALRPGTAPETILPLLNALPAGAVVVLVGHEPYLGRLLCFLLSGKPDSFVKIKKGGVACLEGDVPLQAGRLTLLWLLEPDQLMQQG